MASSGNCEVTKKSSDLLTPEIRRFISNNIDSVAMLEVLLFFRKEKNQEWTNDTPDVLKSYGQEFGAVATHLNS